MSSPAFLLPRYVHLPFLTGPVSSVGSTSFVGPVRSTNSKHHIESSRVVASASSRPRANVAAAKDQPPSQTENNRVSSSRDNGRERRWEYPRPLGIAADMTMRTRGALSIPEIWTGVADAVPDNIALVDEHHQNGSFRCTYSELQNYITVFSAGLRRLGLAKRQTVALFSENSARWLIADQGIMATGAAAAVRGVDAPVHELLYIYEHSHSSVLFIEDSGTLAKVLKAGLSFSSLSFIVILFGNADDASKQALDLPQVSSDFPPIYSFEDVLAKGASPSAAEKELHVKRSDVATILYTSGTTGHPKGVVLTHGNLLAQLERLSIGSIDPVPGEIFLSVLPCWHIFERTAAYYCLARGMQVVYSNKRRFRDDLIRHRPQVLIAVPRVFENLYAAIMHKLEKASASRKRIFLFFVSASVAFIQVLRTVRGLSLHARLESMSLIQKFVVALKFLVLAPLYALANLLVWNKIRSATGGRVRLCVCGGGTVPDYLEDFFEAANIEICVGYGLTETSPVICNRFHEHNVRGSAGLPLPDTQVKIVDLETRTPVPDGTPGELLVNGPQVFSEYYRDPSATAKAFDARGFFDTGDLAYIGPDGDVVITGRSKDVIVLSNGENVEPAPIEDAIVGSPFIDQVMLVGQDEKELCALIVPSLPALVSAGVLDESTKAQISEYMALGQTTQLREAGIQLAKTHPGVIETIERALSHANKGRLNFSVKDRVRHVRLVLEPFSVENGMLTQTLKVKRNVVEEVYKQEITELCRR